MFDHLALMMGVMGVVWRKSWSPTERPPKGQPKERSDVRTSDVSTDLSFAVEEAAAMLAGCGDLLRYAPQ